MKTNIGMRAVELLCWVTLAFCAIAIGRFLVLEGAVKLGLQPPDWGTWISAIGTVGTLIWAVVLANAQERQRRKDSLTLAQLFGAKLEGDVHEAITLLRLNRSDIVESLTKDVRFNAAGVEQRLREIKVWDTPDIALLVPLPKGVAIRLTEAQKVIAMATQNATTNFIFTSKLVGAEIDAAEELLASHEHALFLYALVHEECLSAKQALHFAAEGIGVK